MSRTPTRFPPRITAVGHGASCAGPCKRFTPSMLLAFFVVALADPSTAQSGAPHHMPHYPSPTEKLPGTLPEDAFHPIPLTGALLTDDPALGRVSQLQVQGNLLWVGDAAGNPFLHVIDRRTGVVTRSFGTGGAGPGQFNWVRQLTLRPGDTTGIWVYDGSLRRLTRVVPGAASGIPRMISGLPLIAGGGTVAYDMLWLTRNRILFIGFSDTNRIMFADSLGHVAEVHSGPLLGAAEVPKDIREASSTGTLMCIAPSGARFAIAYGDAARIDLFDSKGKRLPTAKVLFPTDSDRTYFKDSQGNWHNPNPRAYYGNCSATTDRIYALFSGRLQGEPPAGSHYWDAQFVHVYDWSGDLIAVLKLDRLANAIAVAADTVLYAGGGITTGITRYTLPPSIAASGTH